MVIEMKEYFEQVPTIRYEGKNSKNPLAFKHYNKDEVIMGKKCQSICALRCPTGIPCAPE